MNLRGLVYGDSTMLATSWAAAGASLFAACMPGDGRTGRHLEEAEHDAPPLPRRDGTSAGMAAESSGIGSHSSSSASARFSRSRRASAARHFCARPSSSRRCAQRCSSSARCASRLAISSCSAASSASRLRPSEPSHADCTEVVGTADITFPRVFAVSLRLFIVFTCAPPGGSTCGTGARRPNPASSRAAHRRRSTWSRPSRARHSPTRAAVSPRTARPPTCRARGS